MRDNRIALLRIIAAPSSIRRSALLAAINQIRENAVEIAAS